MAATPRKAPNALRSKTSHFPKQPAWKKRTASVARWLHVYLSMVSFVIILFFAVTGLTLNHADWFDGMEQIKKYNGQVIVGWVNVKDTNKIAKLEIVESLRNKHHIQGAVSDFAIDDNQVSVSFKGPGYSADAFINRDNGVYNLTETRMGIVAVMNDLHTGRDSGKKWLWLIDASAIFLTLVSLTGIVMICFMKRKRLNGVLLAIIGALICYLVYYFLVP
jgi:hypothetical protein